MLLVFAPLFISPQHRQDAPAKKSLALSVFPCVNNWIENWKTVSFSSAPASVWGNKNKSCLNSTMVVYRQLSATSFTQLMLYAAVCRRQTHYFVVLQLRVKWMKCSNRNAASLFSFSTFYPPEHAHINPIKGRWGHSESWDVRTEMQGNSRWNLVNKIKLPVHI